MGTLRRLAWFPVTWFNAKCQQSRQLAHGIRSLDVLIHTQLTSRKRRRFVYCWVTAPIAHLPRIEGSLAPPRLANHWTVILTFADVAISVSAESVPVTVKT